MKSKAAAAALLLNVKTPKRCSDSAITALKSQSNVILQIAQNFFPRGGSKYTVSFILGELVVCICRPLIKF